MSLYAMKVRASVLNKFWRGHISDKYGLGGKHGTVWAATLRGSTEGHLLQCDGSNGPGRRMERSTMGGVEFCDMRVDKNQGCSVRWTQKKPTLGHANCPSHYH